MENKSFFTAFGATISKAEIASKAGLSYIAAATAMRLVDRPEVTFVEFDGKPQLEMLGGSVVAVDIRVPGTEATQRTWLPVMDRDQLTLSLEHTQATDINNSRQRCLVKAIACVFGAGMSLFLGCDGEGPKAVKMLGVAPDSDLATVPPIIATLKEGGAPYIEWGIGLAASRITDPTFHWEVVMWDGKPFREVLGSLMVDVDTVYCGKRQRLSLPMMDAAFNAIPSDKATVFDWNKAVMRALTKCIAFNSGYGLGVYADEFGVDRDQKASRGNRKAAPAKPESAEPTTKVVAAPAKVDAPVANEVPNSAEAAVDASVRDAAGVSEAELEAQMQAEAQAAAPAAEVPQDEAKQPEKAAEAPTDVAQQEPAASPAAEVPVPAADSEAVVRFREVMRKRRDHGGPAGVITLFEALATSTKFADADKPNCFAVLVSSCAAIVTGETIVSLLGNIAKYDAMKHLALDTRDITAAKLTSVMVVAACADGDEALRNAPSDLVSAGVAQDIDDVLRLAALGNTPSETMDLLRDVLDLATA